METTRIKPAKSDSYTQMPNYPPEVLDQVTRVGANKKMTIMDKQKMQDK
jgi:hypothetical protein